ncbi:MAG: membrane protein insertase YidC [Sphingomicrobium sp.]
MNDNKNFVIAILLSLVVLLGWSWAADRFFPSPKAPTTQTAPATTGAPAAVPTPGVAPAATPPGPAAATALKPRAAILAASPRVMIDTPSLKGSINLKGAQFDDLVMTGQRQDLTKDSKPVRLLSPIGAPNAYVANVGWSGDGAAVPGFDTLWTADRTSLTPGQPVTLTTQMGDGLRYQLVVAVDDGYLFTVKQTVGNGSAKPVTVRPTGLISRSSKSNDRSSWTTHVGPMSVFDGKADYGTDWKTLDEAGANGQRASDVNGWLGFTDHFWLTALAPAGNTKMASDFRHSPTGGYQADYALAASTLAPGQQATAETRLFAGAKEKKWLTAYENQGIDKLSKAIDWGWFEWFMRPIFVLLLFLFKLTGNFGVAIIGLTLVVRLIMFPIAQKQFASMAAMRKIQPMLKAVQERFKDDKQRQQQEVLKLYQAEKINPAAGCLPILIQIPVFYALYKVLMVSVEMRHQPFVLWIKDLSAPDPLTPVNLFGLLDFSPPTFLAIGVLPILVGFTQWLSMKLNPQPMDPVQKQMFAIMPWLLVFMMAPFAAGLQLYWMTNNILTILQQWWLYRRFGLNFSDTHPVEE